MSTQQLNDSIKIYCNSQLKKQIKNLAAINNKSISNYVVDIIQQHINEVHNQTSVSTLQSQELQNALHRIELLSVNLFKGMYESIGNIDIFEDLCSKIYRKENNNEKF